MCIRDSNKAVEGMLSRSHCHAWSAAPAYFLSRSVLGVKPLAPFWTSVEIAPVPCGLAWAREMCIRDSFYSTEGTTVALYGPPGTNNCCLLYTSFSSKDQ